MEIEDFSFDHDHPMGDPDGATGNAPGGVASGSIGRVQLRNLG